MTTPLLSYGQSLTQSAAPLQTVSLADLANQIRSDQALQHLTGRLRKLAQFDQEAYKTAKTRLPFVVGSVFGQGIRRLEALEAAYYFILDLDQYSGLEGCVPPSLQACPSVALAFVSPSGKGVKLFFRLLTPCPDPVLFLTAYRHFATDFGQQYQVADSIDQRTCDATRACFLAHDPAVCHNPDAMPVDWQNWLPAAENKTELTPAVAPVAPDKPAARKPAADRPINEDAYQQLLRTITPTAAVRRPKQTFVPDELAGLQPVLHQLCGSLNWELTEVAPLNYGLKVAVRQGFRQAEVNVFYGKRGFSVVRSPKTGTDPVLADALHGVLFRLLFAEPVVQQVPMLEALCNN